LLTEIPVGATDITFYAYAYPKGKKQIFVDGVGINTAGCTMTIDGLAVPVSGAYTVTDDYASVWIGYDASLQGHAIGAFAP
jgi:hypothetical protein